MATIKDLDVENYETKTETVVIPNPHGSFTLGSMLNGVKAHDIFLGTGFSIVSGATTFVEGRDYALTQSDEDSKLSEESGATLYSSVTSYRLTGEVDVSYRQVGTYDKGNLMLRHEARLNGHDTDISDIETKNTEQDTAISDLASTVGGHTETLSGHEDRITSLELRPPRIIVADHAAMLALATPVQYTTVYVIADTDGHRAEYVWDGTEFLKTADPDWENINIDFDALINVPDNISAIADAADISTAATGQTLVKAATGGLEWADAAGGSGSGDVISDVSSSVAGNIMIANDTTGKHITDSGVPVMDSRALTYIAKQFLAGLTTPQGIATDGTFIYITDTTNGNIKKINIATKEITNANTTTFSMPFGITYYNRYLYITQYLSNSNFFVKINLDTSEQTAVSTTQMMSYPNAVVTDGTYLYINANGAVWKITIASGTSVAFSSGIANGLNGMATDGTNIYVTEYLTGKIKKIPISTGVAVEIVSGLVRPQGITTDGSYLYVLTDPVDADGKVHKYTLAGSPLGTMMPGIADGTGIATSSGIHYAIERNTGILKASAESTAPILPSSIFHGVVTTANITITEDRFGTIILSGAADAAHDVILNNSVRTYRVINNVTGGFPQTLKTAAGSGVVSYENDRLEIYCDGTNVSLLKANENDIIGVERLTGDYFAGYPVFEKGIYTGQLPNATGKPVAHGLTGSCTFVPDRGITGIAKTADGSSHQPLPFSQPGNSIWIYVSGVNIVIATASDRQEYTKSWTLLRYVKAAL